MPQRSGLGKGLDALIPTTPDGRSSEKDSGVVQLPVEVIVRNPRQPRDQFDSKDLEELAASVREHGIIQPLIVTPGEDETYVLVAGERRLQAAKLVGLSKVPAILRQASDRELIELALIENIQRSELNPLEEADAYRQLTEDFDLSHEEIALRVGKSRPAVSNTLRLLQLSEVVKKELVRGYSHVSEKDSEDSGDQISEFRLTEGHARALLRLTTHRAQDAALERIMTGRLNVRQTEELIKKQGGKKPPVVVKPGPPPELVDLEERLQSHFGTKVTLRQGKKGGAITIHFYSNEELDALLEELMK